MISQSGPLIEFISGAATGRQPSHCMCTTHASASSPHQLPSLTGCLHAATAEPLPPSSPPFSSSMFTTNQSPPRPPPPPPFSAGPRPIRAGGSSSCSTRLSLPFLSVLSYHYFSLSLSLSLLHHSPLPPLRSAPSSNSSHLSLHLAVWWALAVGSPRHERSVSRSPGGSSTYYSVQWA